MGNQIELRHIKYFLAVAEDLHFRRAAERLFISQPGLSRQIKQMEEGLGVELFYRHNRKVELTIAGAFLKEELTRNLKTLDNVFSHAKLLNDGLGGNLKLGYVGSAMNQIIPDLLLRFEKSNQDIVISLKEMDNQKQIESLLSQDIDMGFVRLEKVPRTIEIRPILKEPFCIVLPKEHHIRDSSFTDISQLKNEPFILFDSQYSSSYFEKVMHIFEDAGFVPSVSHYTIHATSIYKLVENGFGVSIVPKSLISGSFKSLKFIELNKVMHRTTLSVVWNRESINPVLGKILEFLY
ncbi:LysR family transcriptional regulator [uncultured Algibacter sp.]|uniref:LysR family transcriptional regulator n=1 Tax=uncultured Algibacter sp. TaxID=298659 RepID=UPI0026238812|nr:LysR family transcriptional regulator [uncultured Algibacter sp.]